MRLFFALEIPPSIQEKLARSRGQVPQSESWRWVKPSLIHLTLVFLGETDPSELEALRRTGRETAADAECFEVTALGSGVFGGNRNPRVLWAGLAPCPPLDNLVLELSARLGRKGDAKHHLTLARRRKGRWSPFAVPARLSNRRWGSWTVEEFVLVESRLTPAGPLYSPLERFRLGRPESRETS